jgi:hypothetical protein
MRGDAMEVVHRDYTEAWSDQLVNAEAPGARPAAAAWYIVSLRGI